MVCSSCMAPQKTRKTSASCSLPPLFPRPLLHASMAATQHTLQPPSTVLALSCQDITVPDASSHLSRCRCRRRRALGKEGAQSLLHGDMRVHDVADAASSQLASNDRSHTCTHTPAHPQTHIPGAGNPEPAAPRMRACVRAIIPTCCSKNLRRRASRFCQTWSLLCFAISSLAFSFFRVSATRSASAWLRSWMFQRNGRCSGGKGLAGKLSWGGWRGGRFQEWEGGKEKGLQAGRHARGGK